MTSSFVYFIAAGEQRIKIGRSRHPEARLRRLQTGSSERLVLLGSVPGAAAEEKALHRKFAEHRINGEWFDFCEAIWSEIDRLLSGASIEVGPPMRKGSANPLLAEVAANMAAYFRALYPVSTAASVAAATGLNQRSIEAMLGRGTAMHAGSFNACLEAFGPSFLAACYPDRLRPKWVTDVAAKDARAQEQRTLETNINVLEAALAQARLAALSGARA